MLPPAAEYIRGAFPGSGTADSALATSSASRLQSSTTQSPNQANDSGSVVGKTVLIDNYDSFTYNVVEVSTH